MTDDQLKAALAKMLPGALTEDSEWGLGLVLRRKSGARVLDTELLHLCSIAESGLTDSEKREYIKSLVAVVNESEWSKWQTATATWQQRGAALAKIKNIEL